MDKLWIDENVVRELPLRDPNERAWHEGWWETTVCWLEVQDGTTKLKKREETFYSEAERDKYLKARVDGGWVFDILWSWETMLGGKQSPLTEGMEEEWEGLFITSRKVSENEVQVV